MYFYIAYFRILIHILINKVKIIHIHTSYKGSFTRAYVIQRLCKLFHVKNVIHLHGSEFKKWYDLCSEKKHEKIKRFLRDSDKFIVLGNEWKKIINNIEAKTKISVINNAIEIPDNSTKWNKEIINILFLGVLIKRKGIYDLIYSIDILNKKDKISKAKFIIAGSGKERKELENLVKKLHIEKYISFVGWIDETKKKELLKECQLLVLPSYNEGLPMSILEALSYGMPVIATKVGDIEEAVYDGKNGFIIEKNNIKELSKALDKFLNFSENEWNEFSRNSLEISKKKFSKDKYIEKFIKIYKEI